MRRFYKKPAVEGVDFYVEKEYDLKDDCHLDNLRPTVDNWKELSIGSVNHLDKCLDYCKGFASK